ncbi:MAG: hypothetical protein EZS28_056569, partial [Streblomastix strix]
MSVLDTDGKYFAPMHLFFGKQDLSAEDELFDKDGNFQLNLNSVKNIAQKFSIQESVNASGQAGWIEVIQRAQAATPQVQKLHNHLNQIFVN